MFAALFDRRGFTLIELIAIIVLIAVLAAFAAPMLMKGPAVVTIGAVERKVRDDIRYAQSLAMSRSGLDTPSATNPSFKYRIRFNIADANCAGTNQYTIVNDADNNGVWGENPNTSGVVESARNPYTGGGYFCVQLDSGDFAGFTVSANFGGSVPSVLEFDHSGIPYDSDGVKLSAVKTVTVAKGGETVSMTVTPNTGMVTAP